MFGWIKKVWVEKAFTSVANIFTATANGIDEQLKDETFAANGQDDVTAFIILSLTLHSAGSLLNRLVHFINTDSEFKTKTADYLALTWGDSWQGEDLSRRLAILGSGAIMLTDAAITQTLPVQFLILTDGSENNDITIATARFLFALYCVEKVLHMLTFQLRNFATNAIVNGTTTAAERRIIIGALQEDGSGDENTLERIATAQQNVQITRGSLRQLLNETLYSSGPFVFQAITTLIALSRKLGPLESTYLFSALFFYMYRYNNIHDGKRRELQQAHRLSEKETQKLSTETITLAETLLLNGFTQQIKKLISSQEKAMDSSRNAIMYRELTVGRDKIIIHILAILLMLPILGRLYSSDLSKSEFIVLHQLIFSLAGKLAGFKIGLFGGAEAVSRLATTHSSIFHGQTEIAAPPDEIIDIDEIALRNITFSYEKGDFRFIIEENLIITHGETIIVVGTNFSGKSTIVDLILGKIRPQEGNVEMNGQEIRQIERALLRNSIGYIPPKADIFAASLCYNLTGKEPQQLTWQEMRRIFDIINIISPDDFFNDFPQGLDSDLSHRKLSEGQKQLIALVRCLMMRPGRSLYIFDEPFDKLDALKVRGILTNLRLFLDNATIILITQDPTVATQIASDHPCRILSITNGRIIQDGTHEELISQYGGLYHRLYTSKTETTQDTGGPAGPAITPL